MFDSKLYKETFSQVQASGETLSEVLNMTKRNKYNGARTARLVLIAAVVTAMLATTAFAYVGFTQYENPMEMLKTFFGGEEYTVDQGGFVRTETYYDMEWDVVLPTVEQVPVDENLAEEKVSPYISDVGSSITDDGDTLTVEAHLYDSATNCGIIYITLENPNGVSGYNLQLDGEVCWPALQRVEVYNCHGKSFIIEEETTDTKLSIAYYYSALYGDEGCIRVGFGGGEEFLYLPLDDGGGMDAIALAGGDIVVSPIGMKLDVSGMEFLCKTDTDGTLLAPMVDNIKTLTIRYKDGTEYVIHENTDEQETENFKYCIQTDTAATRTYSFNRLIDIDQVEAVIINDVEYTDIQAMTRSQRDAAPAESAAIPVATEPANP